MTGVVTVSTGARLHFGFRNLSSECNRLFGSLGVALQEPRVTVTARPSETIDCDHDRARPFVKRAVSLLDLDGASINVEEEIPPHVGLGSGTQLALSIYRAIALANDRDPDVRSHAPAMGRGRRSGVGIATFEVGGLVRDGGHPTAAVCGGSRQRGSWKAPPLVSRWTVPESWRFLIVRPSDGDGLHGTDEAASIAATIDRSSPESVPEVDRLLESVLPRCLEQRDLELVGRVLTRLDSINGSWFAPEQGALRRPPADRISGVLSNQSAIAGVGQSSWGALVYGLTNVSQDESAIQAGRNALEEAGVDGLVNLVAPRNQGAISTYRQPNIPLHHQYQ